MSSGVVIQILVDLIFLAGFTVTWLRLAKPPKDDPRLSRGLQLLQQKIAVLEDLGDQTERQVQQVSQLIEAKSREIQNQIAAADDQIRKIENMMGKSLEVAHIFQDKIPHEEIIDRKSTMKYVKAARMAHQGQSIDEIAEQVDLSRAEIEFVAKVNRNQLQFSEEDLPEWAKESAPTIATPELGKQTGTLKASELPSKASLSQLGDKFRQATQGGIELSTATTIQSVEHKTAMTSQSVESRSAMTIPTGEPIQASGARIGTVKMAASFAKTATVPPSASVGQSSAEQATAHARAQAQTTTPDDDNGPVVKKVIFPRMDELHKTELKKMIDRNLG